MRLSIYSKTTHYHVVMSWFMNIIISTTQASALALLSIIIVLLTQVSCHIEKPIAQMCIPHITTLPVSVGG